MLKKKLSLINTAIVHVKSTFNNTLICVTDLKGNIIVAGSGGSTGLKGQKHNDTDMRRLQRVAHPNVNKIENYEKYLNEAELEYLKNHKNGWIEKHKDAWDILKK